MTSKTDVAATTFLKGFNCAQAVFSTYAQDFGIREYDALRISTGFGGGMGRLQEVCGAVTGAFMLIGCRHGMLEEKDTAAKEAAYGLVREFTQRFRRLHGSISCKELLGCDLTTEEGKNEFREKDLSNTVCLACVRDASRIVEEVVLNR